MSKRGMATIGDKMGPSDLKHIRQSNCRDREYLGMTSRYHDLKIAVRHLLKSSGFVATAILMLA
jgi:hypothetical protein